MKKESEFEVVRAFSHILGLPNKTDGSLFIKAKRASQKNLMAIIFMMALLLY
ncbi:hypothetical protein [Campylobacter upsaliensis]|uniref:hypothetical protein n=1 Tax=Campylobacter upsaliensis TaxID=28080 RepID=UPI002227049D|nr:hypothetical protein [Campylobacter upsaliensis]HEP3232438.1 hypothetical protein [Campylobacter upsaliensis]